MASSTVRKSLILSGPTGIGKTALAVELAHRFPFELISADSMQVYCGLEIGTAQPTPDELRGAPIHGVGVLEPDSPFSVKKFLDLSSAAHEQILSRGRIPLYVGGTGLYLRALRWGLFDEPVGRAEEERGSIRAMLMNELAEVGPEALHARLVRIDPVSANRIPPRDAVRIVRALEVHAATDAPLSSLQKEWQNPRPRFPHELVILNCARPRLVKRIEARIDQMLEAGWVEEVRLLMNRFPSRELHCFKALGYREIMMHLDGLLRFDPMREKIKAQTRRFSKRQMTWFRREQPAHWIEFDGVDFSDPLNQIQKSLETWGIVP